MIGAIVGDIAGSRFEFCNLKAKEFVLLAAEDEAEWGPPSSFTDDAVMTLAVAQALADWRESGSSDYGELSALAVRYAYKDDADRFGNPSPKEAKPFAYRPQLCRRADFSDPSSGFRLPFLDQVGLGYEIYSAYKHDIVGQFPNDFRREDGSSVPGHREYGDGGRTRRSGGSQQSRCPHVY